MKKKIVFGILAFIVIGFLIPQNLKMPVPGAGNSSYNHETYWYGGWGSSVVHKGVDIFARKGTSVHSSTWGIVLGTMELSKGGKCVLVLGPKWRLHYYAHLNEIRPHLSLSSHKTARLEPLATREMRRIPHHTFITLLPRYALILGALTILLKDG